MAVHFLPYRNEYIMRQTLSGVLFVMLSFLPISGCGSSQREYQEAYQQAYKYGRDGVGGRPDFRGKSQAYRDGWEAGHRAGSSELRGLDGKK